MTAALTFVAWFMLAWVVVSLVLGFVVGPLLKRCLRINR